jgi:acetoacetyl-CoA synthetase
MSDELWRPDAGRIRHTQLTAFLNGHGFAVEQGIDYHAAHTWSIDEPADFWAAVWAYCEVVGSPGKVVFEPGEDMRRARFFPHAQLNFAENLLRRGDDRDALVAWGEGKEIRRLDRTAVTARALSFAAWLEAQGVRPGDRVAALLPNIPETVIAMLGTAAAGAVFASASPDFGEQGVLDRFAQIEPRILIACDGYRYNGKLLDTRSKVGAVVSKMPSVERLVLVDYMGLGGLADATDWQAAVASGGRFRRMPFNHPLYIMFSSGTTGPPKCIIHGAGGTLLQHLKEHRLQCDIRPGDRVFYFTTCGWMMWNWLVSALASEASILLYDGSPFHPDGRVLFDFAANERATFFGTSAKYIDAVKKAGLRPRATHDLSRLRTIASTGSPLSPESFDFVYESVCNDVLLASISGGTDIISCFVGANPCGVVRRGEIQAAGLGMAVEIWDDDGQRVTGEAGELVCTRPFPSMPVGFWNDPDAERYKAAYFDKFPDVWCHGDFAIETPSGGYIILGRSDAVLNPGGVRIGTAEIYRQVEQIDEVLESIAVGQQWEGDVRVVLFVVLRPDVGLTSDLADVIRGRIRSGASPRHVPAKIIAVPDIPRTKSGKITELAVRALVHGEPVKNTEALANPEALDHFKGIAELGE